MHALDSILLGALESSELPRPFELSADGLRLSWDGARLLFERKSVDRQTELEPSSRTIVRLSFQVAQSTGLRKQRRHFLNVELVDGGERVAFRAELDAEKLRGLPELEMDAALVPLDAALDVLRLSRALGAELARWSPQRVHHASSPNRLECPLVTIEQDGSQVSRRDHPIGAYSLVAAITFLGSLVGLLLLREDTLPTELRLGLALGTALCIGVAAFATRALVYSPALHLDQSGLSWQHWSRQRVAWTEVLSVRHEPDDARLRFTLSSGLSFLTKEPRLDTPSARAEVAHALHAIFAVSEAAQPLIEVLERHGRAPARGAFPLILSLLMLLVAAAAGWGYSRQVSLEQDLSKAAQALDEGRSHAAEQLLMPHQQLGTFEPSYRCQFEYLLVELQFAKHEFNTAALSCSQFYAERYEQCRELITLPSSESWLQTCTQLAELAYAVRDGRVVSPLLLSTATAFFANHPWSHHIESLPLVPSAP
ncbi:MAG: hypothetical protein RBU37_02750 [Myxococcota bacterium]|jgi:hypothetical protein|nr:hypothetical protein [Myxococcota bacterium]